MQVFILRISFKHNPDYNLYLKIYLFKFIVPADNQIIAQAESLFDSDTAHIELRKSKTGKFVSISAKEMMMNVDSVIERYEEAVKIPGLMAL